MWIPHIIGQVINYGPLRPEEYVALRDEPTHLWVKRANRAHVNLVEQFGAFAGLVVVAHLVGVSTELTAGAAAAFFWLRIIHAIVMIAGFKLFMARTLIFTAAWIALLVIAWEIAAAKLF
tara:strand:- start:1670 stop:2029 length:360 start_codon:yes stop_codon:yes gene_type:complete